jgi:hypothetical protein
MPIYGQAFDRPAERIGTHPRCAWCRAPFDAVKPWQRFCRPSCRMSAFKAQRERLATVLFEHEPSDVLRRSPFE